MPAEWVAGGGGEAGKGEKAGENGYALNTYPVKHVSTLVILYVPVRADLQACHVCLQRLVQTVQIVARCTRKIKPRSDAGYRPGSRVRIPEKRHKKTGSHAEHAPGKNSHNNNLLK
ncbi:MAG: hypothetical protein D3917_02615 [Candidatus Electrothrix sp. AX5]|nr:hypothetical protein [Candidatus Electrothrix sp. AX5]